MPFAFNLTCKVDIHLAGGTVYRYVFWFCADDTFWNYIRCDSCARTIPDAYFAAAEASDFESVAVYRIGIALTCALVSEAAAWGSRAAGGFLKFGITYFVAAFLFAHTDERDVVGAPFVVETT